MSSHHIIREDQEPALVIDTTNAANFELIQQLLEWSPRVMVTQPALEQVLLWGIKIDVVIVEANGVEKAKELVRNQLPVKIISAGLPGEELETALMFLTASKQKAVNIVTDVALETLENVSSLDVSVVQEGKRWVFIRSGRFDKWFPAGTLITIHPDPVNPSLTTEKDGIFTLHREHSFWVCEIN